MTIWFPSLLGIPCGTVFRNLTRTIDETEPRITL
jgi:hypothetical protein